MKGFSNSQGMFDINGFAKSRRIQEKSKEKVNSKLHATRALLFKASLVAIVQQLQAHAAALLAKHGPNHVTTNMYSP